MGFRPATHSLRALKLFSWYMLMLNRDRTARADVFLVLLLLPLLLLLLLLLVVLQGGNCKSPRTCATAFPCAVKQDLVLFAKAHKHKTTYTDVLLPLLLLLLLLLFQGGNCNSPRACATAFPCAVKQDLIWVKPVALPSPLITKKQSNFTLTATGAAAAGGGGGGSNGLNGKQQQQQFGGVVDESDIPIVQELEEPGWVSQVRRGLV